MVKKFLNNVPSYALRCHMSPIRELSSLLMSFSFLRLSSFLGSSYFCVPCSRGKNNVNIKGGLTKKTRKFGTISQLGVDINELFYPTWNGAVECPIVIV